MDALAVAFHAADERMRGLPIHNPGLGVEIVERGVWGDFYRGILITPWCMNLILLPRERSISGAVAPGTRREFELPCGQCTFHAAETKFAEPHWACSLLSPVLDVSEHAMAREIAARIMAELFSPRHGAIEEAVSHRAVTRRELMGGGNLE